MAGTRLNKTGWLPDPPDHRDDLFLYAAPQTHLEDIPKAVDLRPYCPAEIRHQGDIGSCTACAICAAHTFVQLKLGAPHPFNPSALFVYYNARAMLGTVDSDSGAMLRDGMKSIANLGVCNELVWPYREESYAEPPTTEAYIVGARHRAISYHRIPPALSQLRGCLASGYPFVFGFTMYESFLTPEVGGTGIVPLPEWSERAVGGHAVMAVGYDDDRRWLIVLNSWGSGWGEGGYFYLPYSYADVADFWTLRMIEYDTGQ